jgi:iron complex transport system substrate-binding protein
MKSRLFFLVTVLLSLTFVLPVAAQEAAVVGACVTDYDPAVDYFPDKVIVEYAQGFTVEYHNNYKLVTVVQPWQGAEAPIQYLLVQCGTPAPEDVEAAAVIEVPVQKVVTMSTTFLPPIVGQGVLDKLVAVDTILYTTLPEIIAKHEAGDLAEVSPNFGLRLAQILVK